MDTSNPAKIAKQILSVKDYTVHAPIGEFEARLDFRFIPAGPARPCYFTHSETGEKFYLLAFRSKGREDNRPSGDINFMTGPIPAQSCFKIVTELSKKGLPIWKSAELISVHSTDSGA